MTQITDSETGRKRPYDPMQDEDKPARLFGAADSLPLNSSPAPLRPERDLLKALGGRSE